MQKITKKTELATTLRLIAKYCENSGCEILSWYNPAYELANDINQCSTINRYSGDIILATNSMPTMVDKTNHICTLYKNGLCGFPSKDCMNINGKMISINEEITTTDVRLIKWLTGYIVDAKFIETPYMNEKWLKI